MAYHRYHTYVIAYCISRIPSNYLRVFLYRFVLHYDVNFSSKIGWGTVIAVEKAVINDNVRVGHNNCFKGPFTLTICEKALIGNFNLFECGDWCAKESDDTLGYERTCYIGAHSLITHEHYIDTTGGFTLGNNSWIGGRASQFWTHGLGVIERSVTIGHHCYLGSAVRFAPGSALGDRCVLALGSVVTKPLADTHALMGGIPTRLLCPNYSTAHTTSI